MDTPKPSVPGTNSPGTKPLGTTSPGTNSSGTDFSGQDLSGQDLSGKDLSVDWICRGKDPGHPERCEDRVVVALPYLAAVIDGATDLFGVLHEGRTPGWWSAEIVVESLERNAERCFAERWDDRRLLREIDRDFSATYDRLGLADIVRRDPSRRFRSGACVAVATDDGLRLSGNLALIRIDGKVLEPAPLRDAERVFILLRQFLWEDEDLAALDALHRDAIIRDLLVAGIGAAGLAGAAVLRAANRLLVHPGLERDMVEEALRQGPAGIRRTSDPASPLFSSCLDGFSGDAPPRPARLLPWGGFQTVELFSDGYPAFPEGRTCRDWEELIAAANRDDPHRIGRFAAVKGALPGGSHDDRSLVIVSGWTRPMRDETDFKEP